MGCVCGRKKSDGEKKKKARTEGNGEVNVANEGEVGGIGAFGLDELEEGVGSLGEPR
jgi:hypothetical protein